MSGIDIEADRLYYYLDYQSKASEACERGIERALSAIVGIEQCLESLCAVASWKEREQQERNSEVVEGLTEVCLSHQPFPLSSKP